MRRARGLAVLAALSALALPGTAAGQQSLMPTGRVVRQLEFEGNHFLGDATLASAIGTTSSSWFATSGLVRWIGLGEKRYFDELEFRRDVLRLQVLYRRSGFPDVKIDTLVRRTPDDVYVTFRIEEGRPILVESITVNGLDDLPEWIRRRMLVDLPLREGDPFNRFLMQSTADTLTQRLLNRGYPSAQVFTAFESNRERYTASVTFDLFPGEVARFGEARIEGERRLEPAVVQNLLTARPGRRYSEEDLFESQRNLYKSELVSSATVTIDSANYVPGADTVPVLVQLTESPPYRVRAGAGFATAECFRVSAGWTVRNFLGRGRLLDVSTQASRIGVGSPLDFGLDDNICQFAREDTIGSAKLNYNVTATLRRPAFLSPLNTLSLSLFSERRSEFKVYLREDIGASVELARESPRRRLPLSLTYTLSYGRTEATAASFCAFFNACTPEVIETLRQRRLFAALTGRAVWPRANSPIDPTRGYNALLEVTWASRLIGSSPFQQFTRVFGDVAWYRPLSRNAVFSWRLRGGLIFSPDVAVGGQTNAFVPPEQRFYAGGPNDVRGFRRNELGPIVYVVRDSTLAHAGSVAALSPDSVQVAPTGGNTLVTANAELRFPAPVWGSRLRMAIFVDAGGLWERGRPAAAPARIRVTPGFGFRLATPLGPGRLDFGYNPYRPADGPLYVADSETGALTLVEQAYAIDNRSRPFGFLGIDVPLTVQITVGHPF